MWAVAIVRVPEACSSQNCSHGCYILQVADRLEALVLLKKFNHLGGLLLDKQVRMLVSLLADITQRSVREAFATLSQLSMLLSLESINEISEYWAESMSSSQALQLPLENILEQRNDFGNR